MTCKWCKGEVEVYGRFPAEGYNELSQTASVQARCKTCRTEFEWRERQPPEPPAPRAPRGKLCRCVKPDHLAGSKVCINS